MPDVFYAKRWTFSSTNGVILFWTSHVNGFKVLTSKTDPSSESAFPRDRLPLLRILWLMMECLLKQLSVSCCSCGFQPTTQRLRRLPNSSGILFTVSFFRQRNREENLRVVSRRDWMEQRETYPLDLLTEKQPTVFLADVHCKMLWFWRFLLFRWGYAASFLSLFNETSSTASLVIWHKMKW